VNADGTRELSAEPIELDRLEILFKADIDTGIGPGQFREATEQTQLREEGDLLLLRAIVEDAETGEEHTVSLDLPLDLAEDAPEAGGPRPVAPTEDELDWDDDTTYELMFSDAPQPAEDGKSQEGAGPADLDSKGFEALIRALAKANDSPPPPVEVVPAEVEVGAPVDLPQLTVPGLGEAKELLEFLVEQEALELVEGADLGDLSTKVAPVLLSSKAADDKAEAMSAVLIDHDAVDDLFIDDDSLSSLIERW